VIGHAGAAVGKTALVFYEADYFSIGPPRPRPGSKTGFCRVDQMTKSQQQENGNAALRELPSFEDDRPGSVDVGH